MSIDLGNTPVGTPPTPTEQTQIRTSLGVDVRTDASGAFSAGDLGGNARGSNAINIQATRSLVTQVASGFQSVAIGVSATASASGAIALGETATASASGATATGGSSTASDSGSSAFGEFASASSYFATAVGSGSSAIGGGATASGYGCTASGSYSTASGNFATASGNYSTAVGNKAKTTVSNTTEIGYWPSGSVRAGAIRVHGTGMVALTVEETNTAYTDGLATAGSEADGTLMRKGMAFRVTTAGNLIVTYCDAAGAITSKDLGAMT